MNCHFTPLTQDALLHITGPDTLTFLQGQTTCDTREVDALHAIPGVYCTPQGRTVCDFLLVELGEEQYGLRMRRSILETSGATFGKYIIFSKADLVDPAPGWSLVGVWGEHSREALASVFGTTPQGRYGACSGDGFTLVQLDEAGSRFECYLHTGRAESVLEAMGDTMQPGEEPQWQALQVASGVARIEAATTGEFVPQSLNYDLTGHISFTKGCYTGQEVVARLHYRGKPKRRGYLAQLPAGTACSPNTPTFDAVTGKNVGNIVNASDNGNGVLVLVAATAEGIENGLRLGSKNGEVLINTPLPYSLEGE